jgi:hypothetical protein
MDDISSAFNRFCDSRGIADISDDDLEVFVFMKISRGKRVSSEIVENPNAVVVDQAPAQRRPDESRASCNQYRRAFYHGVSLSQEVNGVDVI